MLSICLIGNYRFISGQMLTQNHRHMLLNQVCIINFLNIIWYIYIGAVKLSMMGNKGWLLHEWLNKQGQNAGEKRYQRKNKSWTVASELCSERELKQPNKTSSSQRKYIARYWPNWLVVEPGLHRSLWILMTSRCDFPRSPLEKRPFRKSTTPILLKRAGVSEVTRLGAGPRSPSSFAL